MSAVVLASTVDMSREDWLKVRKTGGIGGSDCAAIMGMNPWKSPMMLYLEKRGELEDREAGEAAYWGTALEPIIADEFKKQTGFHVQRRNAILQHPEHDWMIANVDRLIRDDKGEWGVLEAKTCNQFKTDDWGGDKAPEMHLLQVAHYLAVTGYSYGYLAVLIGGQRYKHIRVERNDELIASIIQIESDFWQRVQDGNPPEWTGMDCDQELLDRTYGDSRPEVVELPPTVERIIEDYEIAKKAEKLSAEAKSEAEAKLKALLGENEVGVYGSRRVSWKTTISQRLDTKKLRDELPATYEKYLASSGSRRFLVK